MKITVESLDQQIKEAREKKRIYQIKEETDFVYFIAGWIGALEKIKRDLVEK